MIGDVLRWQVDSVPVLGALAGLAGAGWAAWWVRRSGRPLRSRLLAGTAVLLTVLALADAVDARFAYLPDVGDVASVAAPTGSWATVSAAQLRDPDVAADRAGGGVYRLPVPGGTTGLADSTALVWLPPQYFSDPARRFPVVYLFHGSPGVPQDWLRGARAAETGQALAAAGLPAVLVMPRLSHGWLDDPECVDGRTEHVETWVEQQLLPTVDASLRTVAGRDGRAFAGNSAGGYCALNLGLKHRDQVGTVLDYSGLTRPTHRGGTAALYGTDAAARARLDTPADYAVGLPADPPTRVWLDTGAGDGEVRPGIEQIAPVLAGRGLEVSLHERPGAHTFHVWAPALVESLAWALPSMEQAAAGPASA